MRTVLHQPSLTLLLSLLVFLAPDVKAQEIWPDGSPMEDWFSGERANVQMPSSRFLITDYGAVADSTCLQTEAIQKTIDAASASGGGTVVVPRGTFLVSSLFFKQGTALYLEEGSCLKGSDDISDYPVAEVHIEGVLQPYIAAIVNAYDLNGFVIAGKGTINGNGLRYWRDFWKRREVNPACTNLEALRPRMIYISKCHDVTISGVTLKDSGFWTLHLYKSDRIRLLNLDITAPVEPVKAPSSDGVDLDGCKDVHIKDCRISVNDDIIALKGGKGPWADLDPDNGMNERVLLEDCFFGHGPGVLTFGSECLGAKNIILRNAQVHGADRLVWFKMRPDTPQEYTDILVEKVSGEVGSALYVHPWTQFFDLKDRKDIPMSYGRNLIIRDCDLEVGQMTDIIQKDDQYRLENIRLVF